MIPALFRRVIIFQSISRLNVISNRHFGKQTPNKDNTDKNTSDVTKSIKSKFAKQKAEHDKSGFTYQTRQKIQNPSGYQHVKRQLRQCNSINEVMKIMTDYKKCEDVQVGTAAIKAIKLLFENNKATCTKETGIKHIDEIWCMMDEYVVGMDSAAYNEYFHACDMMHFDRKARYKFDEMMKHKILPNEITLHILLKTCRRDGNTKKALEYWKTIVMNMDHVPFAELWASFLAVCATALNVELAEIYFQECPYKTSVDVCYRMMSVYKNSYRIDKVLEMKNFMTQQNIPMDIRIYNTIVHAYRNEKQWQEVINVAEEALAINKWNAITIHHLFEANIGLLKITNDFNRRKEILKYIESDIVEYFAVVGELNRFRDARYGIRMLDAYISTFRDGLGSITFEECCSKYNVQYWEHDEELKVPTVNLFTADYSMAKAIFEYIFEKQLHVFRDLGLNIIISHNDRFGLRFDKVTQEGVNEILSSLPTPIKAVPKDPHHLFISSEQTKRYEHDVDEPLFGVD